MKKIIAHKLNEKIQTLDEHLINVAEKSSKTGEKIGISNIMFLVSLLHDLGKSDRNFQKYIWENTNEGINHSSAGARYLLEEITKFIKNDLNKKREWLLFFEILEYVIFAHHGLYDVISDEGESKTEKRRNYDKETERKYYYDEDVKKYIEELERSEKISFEKYISEAFNEFEIIINKVNKLVENEKIEILDENITEETEKSKKISDIKEEKKYFYYHCIIRLILSILKEADITDTVNVFENEIFEGFDQNEIFKLWEETEKNIEEKYKKFEKIGARSKINQVRKMLSETAKKRGKIDKAGIYRLELPTGSGKTLTSFRYAIENAKHQKKDRIIYITAFLSVLEQNAEEIKNLVKNDEYVLEHHSNTVEEKDEISENENYEKKYKEMMNKQYILNSWNSPVVLTTMVQFYNTLFKGKASNIRRFSQLINSVIIIDEVQSLPKKVIYLSNLMTNFLKNFMNCTIIHCTATQPCFDGKVLEHKIIYGNENSENQNIVQMKKDEKNVFERVRIYNKSGENGRETIDTEELYEFIKKLYKKNESILVILNTKKAVKKIYDKLKENIENSDKNLYYLSTNMCAAHRLEKIKKIKERLLKNKKIICISTQLIEAGVDVDFNTVIRSITGIDSIIQSIGRCNREGKLENGNFYIVNYSEEEFRYLKDIKKAKVATSGVLKEDVENIDDLREKYYKRYYINNLEEMRYKIEDSDDILSLLSENKYFRGEYKKRWNKTYGNYNIAQSFKTASNEFNIIENETVAIIVNYDEVSDNLIKELKKAMENYKIPIVKKILKKLQRYTVNSYNIGSLENFAEIYKEYGIYILLDNYYGETGIDTEELSTLII